MKKVLTLFAILLAVVVPSQLMAQVSINHDVTIVVPYTLTFTFAAGGGGIELNAGNAYSDATTEYDISHNVAAGVTISVGIAGAGDPTDLDLDVTAAAPAASGATSNANVPLITAGVLAGVSQDVVEDIGAGTYINTSITYAATVGAGATPGPQVFTVTYTATPN